jgi:hypothetical protein
METQKAEINLLTDDELDAVAGGRMKLGASVTLSVQQAGGVGTNVGGPDWWGIFNSMAHEPLL